ncbi:MAG TPA: hypothetical protein VIP80_05220 [Gemmatimonadales bacterium]|jgi:hypothetical protein
MKRPAPPDTATDLVLGRQSFLRRVAGRSRVTILDGRHEWLARSAVEWLARQQQRRPSGGAP